jgi:hypothetical protein
MSKMPPGSGACCLPNVEGIRYIKIGLQGLPVGMIGLDSIFQQLFAMSRLPEDATDDELVEMARQFNWIAGTPTVEADYAIALRRAYADYFATREEKD